MKRVLLLLVCFISLSLSAKPKVVKLSDYVYYEGEVESKIPNGQGKLTAFNMMGQPLVDNIYNLSKQNQYRYQKDEITGEFHNDTVKNASILFASNWKYSGDVVYELSETGIVYHLQKDGMLQSVNLEDPTRYTNGIVRLANAAKISINLSTNEVKFDRIPFDASGGLSDTYSDLNGFPIDFIKRFDFRFSAGIKQIDYMNTWQWDGLKGMKNSYSNDIGTLKIIHNQGKSDYILELANGDKIDTKTKIIGLKVEKGKLRGISRDSVWVIFYDNGDKFSGSIRFVDKRAKKMYDMPSLSQRSPIYYGALKLDDNVIPYNGKYTLANGNSFDMIDGKSEEELMAQAEAEIAEQERAEEQRQAELKRQQAAREANAKKVAEQRKLLNECNGKTFSFNQYFTPWGGKWQLTNGNASIRFWNNGQEITVRISGTLNILHFREITADGELSCYEKDNPLYGSWYIKIINNKGKKAFLVNRPLGGLKYLLQ